MLKLATAVLTMRKRKAFHDVLERRPGTDNPVQPTMTKVDFVLGRLALQWESFVDKTLLVQMESKRTIHDDNDAEASLARHGRGRHYCPVQNFPEDSRTTKPTLTKFPYLYMVQICPNGTGRKYSSCMTSILGQ